MSPALRCVGRYSATGSPGNSRESTYKDADEKNPVRVAPGWARGAPGSGLVARRERPGSLRVQRGLCCRGSGRRGRRLGGLLGRCSFLCGGSLSRRCSLLGSYGLRGGSGFLCRCCCLLGGCSLLRNYGLLGWSGFLCRCCCLLGGCSLVRSYGLFGGSGFLCWCSCLLGGCSLLRSYGLLGRSSFLRWCCCLLGRCSLLCGYRFGRCSLLRGSSLFSGRFFRSCHHVLLGSICKEHFLSAVDRKRSMEMDQNSISMNTGTPRRAAHCGAVGAGRGVKIHGGVACKKGASPRTGLHRTGIQ